MMYLVRNPNTLPHIFQKNEKKKTTTRTMIEISCPLQDCIITNANLLMNTSTKQNQRACATINFLNTFTKVPKKEKKEKR